MMVLVDDVNSCDICGRVDQVLVGVAAVPGAPVSLMWCEDCLVHDAIPRFVLETWLFSGFEEAGLALPEEPPELAEWTMEMTVFLEGEYKPLAEAIPIVWKQGP